MFYLYNFKMLIFLMLLMGPFMNLNSFLFVFFLEVLYWLLIIQNLIFSFLPLLLSLGIISFSAVEGATLFSFVMSFMSKLKKKIFFKLV
uniref:NADH dehydrogenase subunit 4L n=1 Tax=Diplosoma listerianum TaxID=168635 RepID=D1GL05_9ASCI|nr:NADH dehydrogenase subunit 4L [Diplosoma listerianum]